MKGNQTLVITKWTQHLQSASHVLLYEISFCLLIIRFGQYFVLDVCLMIRKPSQVSFCMNRTCRSLKQWTDLANDHSFWQLFHSRNIKFLKFLSEKGIGIRRHRDDNVQVKIICGWYVNVQTNYFHLSSWTTAGLTFPPQLCLLKFRVICTNYQPKKVTSAGRS